MTPSNYLFQVSPVPMWVFDNKTLKFLAVNDAAVHVYGYSTEEFLSMTVQVIQPEEEQTDIETKHITKHKQVIDVDLTSSTVDFEGREAKLVVSTDITKRIKTERELEEKIKLNTEKYNIISKATSDTVWDWNLLTDKILWNKGIKGIFGYKDLVDNTTSGEWWAMQIHPEDRKRVTENINDHISRKIERWRTEYRFACADGCYKYVLDRGFMVFDHTGAPVRMIGGMQDISQRKQEEQWSRLLESVVINATDAVLIFKGNTEGRGHSIIYVNEAFTRMSGYTRQELIGVSPRISQGPETDITEIRKLKRAIVQKIPCQIEIVNYTKQGKSYWVSQSNAPIADAEGVVTHWISIQRDITQNKEYLKEIEEQNKKFKEIAWIQSHLVRAPLARVMGLVDLLKNFVSGDEGDELLLHLENSAKELDAIIINIADKMPEERI